MRLEQPAIKWSNEVTPHIIAPQYTQKSGK